MLAKCRLFARGKRAWRLLPGDNMLISDAQNDLRRAYVGGGPGVVISGVIWLVATLIQPGRGISTAFAALFLRGDNMDERHSVN